ncbi:MAG: transcriptional regulator TbsP [Salinirussus sp.]
MQGSTLHDETVADVVATGLDGATETVLAVNPNAETFKELLASLEDRSDPPTARALLAEDILADLVEDFLVASVLADLRATDKLEVRTMSQPPNNALFVSDETITAVVDAGELTAGLSTTESDAVDAAIDHYEHMWAEAEQFSPRTPPLSRLRETLATEVGEEATADFEAVLGTLDSVRGNGDGVGEVAISLLVAARNGVLLYDISKWGEDVGLASKATFSRTKTDLEEAGLIETEKVPIEVGRPRLRLTLGDERLGAVPPGEMVERANRLLSES